MLITSLAVLLESLHVDAVPDDGGLEDAARAASKALDAYNSAVIAPTAAAGPAATGNGGGYDPQLRASLMLEQLQFQNIEAGIELKRLVDHVTDECYKYHHAIWSGWSGSRIAQAVQLALIDPTLVEHRFYGFDLDRGILRISDIDTLERNGIKWRDFVNEISQAGLQPKSATLQLPAPGAWSEAVRGDCDALDAFVSRYREIDVAVREAYLRSQQAIADQQSAEADRRKARVVAGLLDDPTPYGRADRLELELGQDAQATAQPGTTQPDAPATPGAGPTPP